MTNIELIVKIEFDVFRAEARSATTGLLTLYGMCWSWCGGMKHWMFVARMLNCGRGWKAHSQKSGCRPIKIIFDTGSSSTNSPRSVL